MYTYGEPFFCSGAIANTRQMHLKIGLPTLWRQQLKLNNKPAFLLITYMQI